MTVGKGKRCLGILQFDVYALEWWMRNKTVDVLKREKNEKGLDRFFAVLIRSIFVSSRCNHCMNNSVLKDMERNVLKNNNT